MGKIFDKHSKMPNYAAMFTAFLFLRICIRCENFELIILHTNDLHSKFETWRMNGVAVGGIARIISFIQDEKKLAEKNKKALIYLDAGDMFTGTIWFVVHSTNITGLMTKTLDADATCVGNHEFDLGVEGLRDHIEISRKKLVCCNCIVSEDDHLRDKIVPSKTLIVRGRKIGIIGYLNRNSRTIDRYYGKVKIVDEKEPIKEEIRKFKQEGVNIIVGLSHAGYEYDQEVAAVSEDLDIIVGGHSHSFLYSGKEKIKTKEKPRGPYPTIVKNGLGEPVYVVQAGSYGKYVGKLEVVVDEEGVVKSAEGGPHVIDDSVPENPIAKAVLKNYQKEVDELRRHVIGTSYVTLDGFKRRCRKHECNVGNLITDAFVYHYAKYYGEHVGWSSAGVAFIGGGSINDGIKPTGNFSITYADMLQVLPHQNSLVTFPINGSTLKMVLEQSISWRNNTHKGEFLQYSGLRVVYDFSQPIGTRVLCVNVRCANCDVPVYEPLEEKKMYNVTTVDFVAGGGYKYSMLAEVSKRDGRMWGDVTEVVVNYTSSAEFLAPDTEERIVIINDNRFSMSGNQLLSSRSLLLLYLMFVSIT